MSSAYKALMIAHGIFLIVMGFRPNPNLLKMVGAGILAVHIFEYLFKERGLETDQSQQQQQQQFIELPNDVSADSPLPPIPQNVHGGGGNSVWGHFINNTNCRWEQITR